MTEYICTKCETKQFSADPHSTLPCGVCGHPEVKTREELKDEIVYDNGRGRVYLKRNLTCHTCPTKEVCKYAYDPYNTNGDCLAMK